MVIEQILAGLRVIKEKQPFPYKEMAAAVEQREKITPYLLESLDYICQNAKRIYEEEEPYDLHIYAMFLLAQFREKAAFPKLIEILKLDEDIREYFIGDMLTEDYPALLYSTYDGQLPLLTAIIESEELDSFVRNAALHVLEILYQHDEMSQEDLVNYLHQLAQKLMTKSVVNNDSIVGASTALIVANQHFVALREDVAALFDHDCVDIMYMGNYDAFLDDLFADTKRSVEKESHVITDAAECISSWNCFTSNNKKKRRIPSEKEIKALYSRINKNKIGSNDPCPCGSGKKYKKCCQLKETDSATDILSTKYDIMAKYPALSGVSSTQPAFTDYFDAEAIAVDIPVYKVLRKRNTIFQIKQNANSKIMENIENLKEAYEKFTALCDLEGISDLEEYDKKHMVHYHAEKWLNTFHYHLEELTKPYMPSNSKLMALKDQVVHTIVSMGGEVSPSLSDYDFFDIE